jgi:hypothetical protein
VVVLTASACGDGGEDGFTLEVGEPFAGLEPGSAALPPAELPGLTLRSLQRYEGFPPEGSPVIVTRVDGQVVTVATDDDHDFDVVATWGAPGPDVNGSPSVLTHELAPAAESRGLAFELDGTLVTLGSHTADPDQLAEVAAGIRLPVEDGLAGGEVLGVLGASPTQIQASYSGDEVYLDVVIEVVDAAAQAAYRALVHDDPAVTMDTSTQSSCCAAEVMAPAREVEVAGRTALSAAITPFRRLFLVPGASAGLAVISADFQSFPTIAPDELLVRLATGITAGSEADLDAKAAAATAADVERRVATLTEEEQARGWDVVAHGGDPDGVWVISAGAGPRDDTRVPEPVLCARLDLGGEPSCLGPAPPDPIAGASDAASGAMFGAVDDSVARVEVAFAAGTAPTEILELPDRPGLPRRVFFALIPVLDQIELTGELTEENILGITYVAYDAAGNEVGRAPANPR